MLNKEVTSMYLYYDRTGKLKEVINDEALRQGNYGVNKLYIYIDRNDVASIDITYLLPSELIVGPGNYSTRKQEEIPFDEKRDIYWFKYHKTYNFFVINLEADINGNGPLDEAGLVHCDMQMNLDSTDIYTLGELNFNVEVNSVLNQNQVATQEYMSLSNYLFLRSMSVPYTGATKDLDLGAHEFKFGSGSSIFEDEAGAVFTNDFGAIILVPHTYLRVDTYIVSNSYELYGIQAGLGKGADNSITLYNNDGDINVDCYGEFKYKGSEVATHSDLPSGNICAFFYTNAFTLQEGGNYAATDIQVTDFIEGSNMIIITWDNCFALCPIPQSGPGRVCAAMWSANGESQIVRIKYELKDNNTKLDISLSGGFTPPSGHSAIVQCVKLF